MVTNLSSATTCILHLGAHKTGTSLIQKFLRDRPEAVDQLGAAFISRSDTNQLIGWGAVPRQDPGLLKDATNAVAAGVDFVIVSHENSLGRPLIPGKSGLYPEADRAIEGIRNAVELPAKVIYYIRAQADFVESYYLQTVHQGSYASFRDWVATIDLDDLSWEPLVSSLDSRFGSENVVIADFAFIEAGQNAFIERFLDLIKPGHGIIPDYSAKRNLSISQLGLDIALAINPLLESADERRTTRKFLQRHFNNSRSPRPELLNPEQKSALQDRYGDENRNLIRPTVEVA